MSGLAMDGMGTSDGTKTAFWERLFDWTGFEDGMIWGQGNGENGGWLKTRYGRLAYEEVGISTLVGFESTRVSSTPVLTVSAICKVQENGSGKSENFTVLELAKSNTHFFNANHVLPVLLSIYLCSSKNHIHPKPPPSPWINISMC